MSIKSWDMSTNIKGRETSKSKCTKEKSTNNSQKLSTHAHIKRTAKRQTRYICQLKKQNNAVGEPHAAPYHIFVGVKCL